MFSQKMLMTTTTSLKQQKKMFKEHLSDINKHKPNHENSGSNDKHTIKLS